MVVTMQEEVLLTSSGYTPGMLLNILLVQKRNPPKALPSPRWSIVSRLRNPALYPITIPKAVLKTGCTKLQHRMHSAKSRLSHFIEQTQFIK